MKNLLKANNRAPNLQKKFWNFWSCATPSKNSLTISAYSFQKSVSLFLGLGPDLWSDRANLTRSNHLTRPASSRPTWQRLPSPFPSFPTRSTALVISPVRPCCARHRASLSPSRPRPAPSATHGRPSPSTALSSLRLYAPERSLAPSLLPLPSLERHEEPPAPLLPWPRRLPVA